VRNASIREASFDDYEQIAALESRSGLHARPRPQWSDLWAANPVYRQLPGWPLGWVLETAERKIAGYVGNVPLHYQLEGQTLLTATARAWTVEPEFRNYALPLLNNYFHQSGVDLYLNTTINANSGGAFMAYDSTPVPAGEWDRAGFWVVGSRAFARNALAIKVPAASAVLELPVAAGIALRSAVARMPAPAIDVEERDSFDACFEVFWTALRRAKHNILLGVRSRESLEWHFHHYLARGELWIAVAGGARGMAAYAIFLRRDYQGLTRVRLADFQSLEPSTVTLQEMLRWAHAKCRATGTQVLEVVGNGQHAPFHRRLQHWSYYYKTYRSDLARKLRDPKVWEPSSFDGDGSL
jgi:hypothetical protein